MSKFHITELRICRTRDYFHGLGGYLDRKNQQTSFYKDAINDAARYHRTNNDPVRLKPAESEFQGFKYDVFSLNTLKQICENGFILPRSETGITSYESDDAYGNMLVEDIFCPFTKYSVSLVKPYLFPILYYVELPDSSKYIERSLSIILEPDIENYFKHHIYSFEELRELYPIDMSLTWGEFRIEGSIGKKHFKAVSLPVSNVLGNRFSNISDYINAREEEIKIIRRILTEAGIDIPIIDTITSTDLEGGKSRKFFDRLRRR